MKRIKVTYKKVQEFELELWVNDSDFESAVSNIANTIDAPYREPSDIAITMLDQKHIDYNIRKSVCNTEIDMVDDTDTNLHSFSDVI